MRPRCVVVPVLALFLIAGVLATSVRTAGAQPVGSSSDHAPTWWGKYVVLSSDTSRLSASSGSASSVSVGPNIDVSNEPGPQSETSIAINPENPSEIVAGSNEIFRLPMRGYFSSDGGASWGGVDLPLPANIVNSNVNFGSDPGVAWDTRGDVFYVYIVVFFNGGPNIHSAFSAISGTELAVARSSDGGQHWTSTYFSLQRGTARFNDKPYIAVDTNPGSPFRDTVYVAWDQTSFGGLSTNNGILVSSSTNGGLTFSNPVFASDTMPGGKADIGADPFVGPGGTLFVAWHDVLNNRLMVASSKDGGTTFGTNHVISPTIVRFDIGIPAMDTRRALLYPACAVDSSTGSRRGTLFCSWMDLTATDGTDVFVAHSSDGTTWSAPVRVNDDPTAVANDQFNQWLAVDPTDGSISVSFYDTRNDPTHVSTDVYYARSTDGSLTFGANVKVTTASTNEATSGADPHGNQYGDYEGIAALGGSVHPVWTDRRASLASDLFEEVFTATITVS